jgi:hypothetical protein
MSRHTAFPAKLHEYIWPEIRPSNPKTISLQFLELLTALRKEEFLRGTTLQILHTSPGKDNLKALAQWFEFLSLSLSFDEVSTETGGKSTLS